MPAKRKHHSGAIGWVPALKTAIIVMLIATAAVGYVIEKNKLIELSKQITAREARLEKLRWENKLRASQLDDRLLPQKLAARVKEMRLNLVPAQQTQMVWLVEPCEPRRTNATPSLLVWTQ
jgi:hypothetical protein